MFVSFQGSTFWKSETIPTGNKKSQTGSTAESFAPRCMGFVSRPGRHGWFVPGIKSAVLEIKSSKRLQGIPTCGVLTKITGNMENMYIWILNTYEYLVKTWWSGKRYFLSNMSILSINSLNFKGVICPTRVDILNTRNTFLPTATWLTPRLMTDRATSLWTIHGRN